MRRVVVIIAFLLRCCTPSPLASQIQKIDSILRCEAPTPSCSPGGWNATSSETVHLDMVVLHSGRSSLCITWPPASNHEFTAVSVTIGLDFAGDSQELRGLLRSGGVDVFAGSWAREDGRAGLLEFDNMHDRV
jgi:hypothetical protein